MLYLYFLIITNVLSENIQESAYAYLIVHASLKLVYEWLVLEIKNLLLKKKST